MKHLTDDQIQSYLDGNRLDNIEKIKQHLSECSECQTQLDAYENLYVLMGEKSEIPDLSDTFATNTMSKIKIKDEKKWTIFENVFIVISFIISISLIIYFFNFNGIVSIFKGIDFSLFSGISKKLINALTSNTIYLIVAIVITVAIELIDRLKIQKSIKHLNH